MALEGSLSLEVAGARIAEARANLATLGHGVSADPSLTVARERDASSGFEGNVGKASLSFSWLLDPWGARKARRDAARARIDAADAERDAAQLALINAIANAYVDLRYQQRLLAVRRQEEHGRRQTLALVRRLHETDNVTRLEL